MWSAFNYVSISCRSIAKLLNPSLTLNSQFVYDRESEQKVVVGHM